jgi:predicted flap endonuclease-1-like 5' DNA nuclease
MRSDYVLYAVAIIFFILTISVAAYAIEQQLWIVTTAVLGLVFFGLGYTQRPKPTPEAPTQIVTSVPPPPPTQTAIMETAKKEEPVAIAQPQPSTAQPQPSTAQPQPSTAQPQPVAEELMKVKGIKERRTAQLKALGINNLEDLAKASAKDIAAKLQISPKITEKWIANAKEIREKA